MGVQVQAERGRTAGRGSRTEPLYGTFTLDMDRHFDLGSLQPAAMTDLAAEHATPGPARRTSWSSEGWAGRRLTLRVGFCGLVVGTPRYDRSPRRGRPRSHLSGERVAAATRPLAPITEGVSHAKHTAPGSDRSTGSRCEAALPRAAEPLLQGRALTEDWPPTRDTARVGYDTGGGLATGASRERWDSSWW